MSISRRNLVTAAAFPLVSPLTETKAAEPRPGSLKLIIAGGHPGDPECGCGGTAARYSDLGHEVALLYMNRGEGFCHGFDPKQCGAVRSAEAQKACRILKARAVFVGQYDGRAIVDNQHYEDFRRLFDSEKPDIVFAHWPVDRHRDHRALSMLVLDAWLRGGRKSALYFYEVSGDTMMFSPTEFVDISSVESTRRAACYAHESQQPEKWYPGQVELTHFRGTESGFPQAEAFLRHWESKRGLLP
ncbi:MAG: PIG-L family deacetylase [Acidobacteriota bacterium]|nr:PIG-L family deacetylase [Acidobacteriota bacterium]